MSDYPSEVVEAAAAELFRVWDTANGRDSGEWKDAERPEWWRITARHALDGGYTPPGWRRVFRNGAPMTFERWEPTPPDPLAEARRATDEALWKSECEAASNHPPGDMTSATASTLRALHKALGAAVAELRARKDA